MNESVKPDIAQDIEKGIPLDDNSVDEIGPKHDIRTHT